jgi:hypothetical protein
MNRTIKVGMIICMLMGMILGLIFYSGRLENRVDSLESSIEASKQVEVQEEVGTIEGQYTMITDLNSVMYVNEVKTDTTDAVFWTDTNGIKGFDVTCGTTHYRYIEGHIIGKQLALYAPYINIMDGEY